jgi:ABC-type transport system involved in multi-copper enzyme maturation permease subunit
MFKAIFAKELLENFASRRFLLVLVLCLILIPFGVYFEARDYEVRLHAYQESLRLYQQDHKFASDILFNGGGKGFRPPSPLGFLSQGLDIVVPNIAESPATVQQKPPIDIRLNNNQSYENLYASFYGPLDLVFIVSVIMTFLAIVFTFGAVSAEKDHGTLRQILANSVPRSTVILAKTAASFLVLVGAFLVAMILSLLVLVACGYSLAGPGGVLAETALTVVLSILVIGAFLNLGLLVSALTRQAVSSFIILLLCWVFLFGVFPRLSVVVAQLISPVKSQQLVLQERNRVRLENEKARRAEIAKIVESGDNTQEKQDAVSAAFKAKLTEAFQKLDRDEDNRQNAQMQLAVNISRLSPVSCFVRPMAEIARTGWMQFELFRQDVGRFGAALDDKVYGLYQEFRQKGGSNVGFKGDGSASAPVFQAGRIRTGDVVKNVLPDALLLVVFNLLFFAGAYVAFLRYDVR